MSQAARKNAAANSHVEPPGAYATSRTQKISVFLVTQDEALWPQVSRGLDRDWSLKQVDTIDELRATTRAGQSGIIVWDARDRSDRAGDLSHLQLHSARFAIIALDAGVSNEPWRQAVQQQRIVALLQVPFDTAQLLDAFSSARDECQARSAVLEEPLSAAPLKTPPHKYRRIAFGILAAVCATGFAYLWYRSSAAPPVARNSSAPPHAGVPAPAAVGANVSMDEQVDAFLEKARQAMRDRRFMEPAGDSALAMYQNVLLYDPNNGEARQGLQRLAQILFARVQSDLEDKKFDLALQSLETARSISPDDPRLTDLDARIESLRAELGPTQIQAALNAKNFDRALQLLDEAERARSLSKETLDQLRDELKRRQDEAAVAHLLKLLGLRIQQDRLLEPHDDSAVYYLQQARHAGASPDDLQQPSMALGKRLVQAARSALDQQRLSDADRLVSEARNAGGPAKMIATLQHDLDAAHEALARDKLAHSQMLELAQTRLAQGALLGPDNDNALFYFNQLRAADPTNAALAELAAALQRAIGAEARAALEAADTAKAGSLIDAASALGSSADLDSLRNALEQRRLFESGPAFVPATSLAVVKALKVDYPRGALSRRTEGWVDLAFTVTKDGKVANISVLDASPHDVFESAAKSALSRVRYRAFLRDGTPTAVTSTLRVSFRLDKP